MNSQDIGATEYLEFGTFLERQCGIVLGDSKQYLVRSRLTPLLRQFDCADLTDLVRSVVRGQDRVLIERVIDAMTTNETLWFRDNYPFDLLSTQLLDKLANKPGPLRIWSAACSSGQEPYSIAMTIAEYKRNNPGKFNKQVEIIATDLSSDMLALAKEASYDRLSVSRGLSEQRKSMFFNALPNGQYQLNNDIRSMVSFRPVNLLESFASLGRFDLIFCRNVLIYFSSHVKRKILQQIAACLQNDGILFLGASESLSGLTDDFIMVRCSPGLYYQRKSL